MAAQMHTAALSSRLFFYLLTCLLMFVCGLEAIIQYGSAELLEIGKTFGLYPPPKLDYLYLSKLCHRSQAKTSGKNFVVCMEAYTMHTDNKDFLILILLSSRSGAPGSGGSVCWAVPRGGSSSVGSGSSQSPWLWSSAVCLLNIWSSSSLHRPVHINTSDLAALLLHDLSPPLCAGNRISSKAQNKKRNSFSRRVSVFSLIRFLSCRRARGVLCGETWLWKEN